MKVLVSDLELGMYVNKLDRPWVESPFLFQGFLLTEDNHIQQLRDLCGFVYVDTEQSITNALKKLQRVKESHAGDSGKNFIDALVVESNNIDASSFEQKLVKAKHVHEETRNYISQVLRSVYHGATPDVEKAKTIVSDLVDSIVNNSDTLILLTQLKSQDESTVVHSTNVCILSIAFGRYLGLPLEKLRTLGLGALFHDIGNMKISDAILKKRGALTKDEASIMKAHAFLGYELLKNEKGMTEEILSIIKNHHERIDGSGYPMGLKGDEICQLTKIVSMTDEYDELINQYDGEKNSTQTEALHHLYNLAEDKYEHQLIELFIQCIGIYPIGSIVETNTGHVGVVVKLNDDNKLKPVVGLMLSRKKELYEKMKFLNLASDVWQKSSGVKVKIEK